MLTFFFSLQEVKIICHKEPFLFLNFLTQIRGIWDELVELEPLPTDTCETCTDNLVQKFYKIQQNQRVTQFLMKLDPRFKQMRTNILMLPELPTLGEVYNMAALEERYLELKTNESLAFRVDSYGCNNKHQSSFRRSNNQVQDKGQFGNALSGNKRPNSYYCDHCKVYGHSLERCWKVNQRLPMLFRLLQMRIMMIWLLLRCHQVNTNS